MDQKLVRFFAIAAIIFAVGPVASLAVTNQTSTLETGRKQALKLLDQYQATMSQLQHCILKTRGSNAVNNHYTADMNQSASGRKTIYFSDELRLDSNRVKLCQRRWGPVVGINYEEKSPVYSFELWDGTNGWEYSQDPAFGPSPTRPQESGCRLLFGAYTNQQTRMGSIIGISCEAHFLLGYFPRGTTRIDETFRQATSISVRGKTEMVDGSACYVIDAVGKSGRSSIWLDPQHGYLIAKAEHHVKAGDFINNHIQKTGTVMDFELTDVRFRKVNDTWVTASGTLKTHKVWLPDGYENEKQTMTITDITVNPDFSTLPNAFALDEVSEVAKVFVRTNLKGNFIWRAGKIQPAP